MVVNRDGTVQDVPIRGTDAQHPPFPIAQRVFHAPELLLILQAIGSVPAEPAVPPESDFDMRAIADARATLLRNGALILDAQGVIHITPELDALVRPAVAPESVILASITDKGPQDQPARMICFSHRAALMVVNWVDARADHHFAAYPVQDGAACVMHHLVQACNLDVNPPDASQTAPTARDVERAAEQMTQAVSLTRVTGMGTPDQTAVALGWFISNGSAWLIPPAENGRASAPRRASRADIIRTVQAFAQL